jgi:hypothetical protein
LAAYTDRQLRTIKHFGLFGFAASRGRVGRLPASSVIVRAAIIIGVVVATIRVRVWAQQQKNVSGPDKTHIQSDVVTEFSQLTMVGASTAGVGSTGSIIAVSLTVGSGSLGHDVAVSIESFGFK